MPYEILMPAALFDDLTGALFPESGSEGFAFALAGMNVLPGYTKFLVSEIVEAGAENVVRQGSGEVEPAPHFIRRVIRRCRSEGWVPLEIHSHPTSGTDIAFSQVDLTGQLEDFIYLSEKIPAGWCGAIVLGRGGLDAHVWDREEQVFIPVRQLRIISCPLKTIVPTSARRRQEVRARLVEVGALPPAGSPVDWDIFDRQVRALGAEGQRRIAATHVALVGLGGAGAVVAQQLAHLGASQWTLIDPDVVQLSNLNRLVAATADDAQRRTPKVEVARRYIRALNENANIAALQASVSEREALAALKAADIIIGCTDDDGSRLVLNLAATRYLIPYIDVGVGIEVDPQGSIWEMGAQVNIILPGQACLECQRAIDHAQAEIDLLPDAERQARARRGYIEGEPTPDPAVIFLNARAASIAVQEFVNLLTGFKEAHSYIYVDALRNCSGVLNTTRRPDCSACGLGSPFGLGDLAPLPDFSAAEADTGVPPAMTH